ncbi:MAG: ribonuclease HI [Proteobacteria bacterium]|nr:ribonuclease HI [Pseudomonadota bacterium]
MPAPVGPSFTCSGCGTRFSLPPAVVERYPGWVPRLCQQCRGQGQGKAARFGRESAARRPGAEHASSAAQPQIEANLSPREVLEKYDGGPYEGVFTDGACSGNPGPGGWGVVVVRNNEMVDERHGRDPDTTNNRMELMALIAGYELLPEAARTVIYSDSQLCVRTINEWAAGWAARGWRRKTGPVQNLELVQRAYALAQAHPGIELRWIKAHNGARWNEYADALATTYLREAGA